RSVRRQGRRAVLPDQHPGRPRDARRLPRARQGRDLRREGALRWPSGHLPVPGHAHGHRLGADDVRQHPGAAPARRGAARSLSRTPRRRGTAFLLGWGMIRPTSALSPRLIVVLGAAALLLLTLW